LVGTRFDVDLAEVKNRLRVACERATKEYPLRSNSVHPLTRKNTQTNTGEGIPVIKVDFVPDSDTLEMWMAPKGSGSENMSFLRMLKPADGVKAVKKFVLECVFDSGANPCPPTIVGVGLGGTSDAAAAMAVNIEWAHTHISQLPVAVNMQCWRGERASAVIDADGNVAYGN